MLSIGQKQQESQLVKRLLRERNKLSITDKDILVRSTQDNKQIVLPSSHHHLIFQELHVNMAHLRADRVYQLAKERVYWPNMEKDIKEFITTRCQCLSQKTPHHVPYAPLGTITSSAPMSLIAIDFLKVDRCSGGYEYIIVIVDHFKRYTQAFATRNKSGRTVAEKLFNDFILRFGIPDRILHDQGGEFENRLFKELEKYLGVKHCRTTPYHPMCNGMVKRMNSILLQMLRTSEETCKSQWKDELNKLVYAYNCTKYSVTGYSPYYLLFGRKPRLPVDY